MIKDWLEVCKKTELDEVRLLNSARQILNRLEIEEDIYQMIDASASELRTTLRVWNQNNSERKESDLCRKAIAISSSQRRACSVPVQLLWLLH